MRRQIVLQMADPRVEHVQQLEQLAQHLRVRPDQGARLLQGRRLAVSALSAIDATSIRRSRRSRSASDATSGGVGELEKPPVRVDPQTIVDVEQPAAGATQRLFVRPGGQHAQARVGSQSPTSDFDPA